MTTNPYRNLPSVHQLVEEVQHQLDDDTLPHDLLVSVARAELDRARAHIKQREEGTATDAASTTSDEDRAEGSTTDTLVASALARLRMITMPSLRPVINATGVIIQTNLGRAPLSSAALAAMQRVSTGYSNLEYDLEAGNRGSRNLHATTLLCQLTGAEDALVVNNNAAALYLVLTTLAAGHEVIVSRGQAVEIGGGFRIPDVLRQSGATLIEVGTTNRTYIHDYANALTERTALLLRVHTSNFRLMGFVHETSLQELCSLGRERYIPVLDDLGSGTLLPTAEYGLAPEPTVQESIAAGADLVTFSGDKLLGGPQAGIIVGRKELVARLRRSPMARAVRVDKTTIAALEATLRSYLYGSAVEEIPVWRMIAASMDDLCDRAEGLAIRLTMAGFEATVLPCESAVGGGSLPGTTLESVAVAPVLEPGGASLDRMAHALRTGTPAIVPRLTDDELLLDMRTVLPEQDEAIYQRMLEIGGELGEIESE